MRRFLASAGINTIVYKRMTLADFPSHAEVSIHENGTTIYTPKPGYHGPDTFTLEVCGLENGREGCADVHFLVTVE